MKIYIGCDHAGYEMKAAVKEFLESKGHIVQDMGGDGGRVDYPEIAKKVGKAVVSDDDSRGILICGTGIGMSIAANKVKGVRAALCADHFSAKYTRLHNDANVMCMGARTLGVGVALELAELFIDTQFEGGRHETRVNMIHDMEEEF